MILFHGTGPDRVGFDELLSGEGAEANAALGVWLSASPHAASLYARGRILVCEILAPRLAVARDRETAIWGGPDLMPTDREIGWPRFDAARRSLAAAGFDGVWCEMPGTDLEGAACIFDHRALRVLRVAEPDGDALDALEAEFGGRDDSSIDLAVSLEDALSAAAGDAPSP